MKCKHCGEAIRVGETFVDWPWIHEHGFYGCIGQRTLAEPESQEKHG